MGGELRLEERWLRRGMHGDCGPTARGNKLIKVKTPSSHHHNPCPQVWEGEGVVKSARKLIGATNPLEAEPGTIRGDLAVQVGGHCGWAGGWGWVGSVTILVEHGQQHTQIHPCGCLQPVEVLVAGRIT